MSDNLFAGCRILVVEDEVIIAMLLENMLDEIGCEVIGPAANVEQALDLIETGAAPDAAVLDINLDGEDSYPVADVLIARDIPFMFSTGYSKTSVHDEYAHFQLLQKPYSIQEISDALTAVLPPKKRVGAVR